MLRRYLRRPSWHSRTIPVVALIVCCVGVAGDLPGCGDSAEVKPRLGGNQIVRGPAPKTATPPQAPVFDVVTPKAGELFKPGDPITCKINMALPHGVKPPTFVFLYLKRGQRDLDSASIRPMAKDSSGNYTFRSELKAPTVKGKYTLHVVYSKLTIYEHPGQSPQTRVANETAASVDVVVGK